MRFITEDELQTRFGLGQGSELRLAHDERLTPAAQNLVSERRIRVLYVDDAGHAATMDDAGALRPLAALNTAPVGKAGRLCSQCGSHVAEKPEHLTHLDAATLAPKNHPRILLRGKLDSLTAYAVLIQTQYDTAKKLPPELHAWLADLRSWVGNILQAEVTGEECPEYGMGGLGFAEIRKISHFPDKHLGRDHLLPDAKHGPNAALLNLFRAQARETELAAAALPLARPDLIRALNRLSSAVYVLMLLTVVCEQGKNLREFVSVLNLDTAKQQGAGHVRV